MAQFDKFPVLKSAGPIVGDRTAKPFHYEEQSEDKRVTEFQMPLRFEGKYPKTSWHSYTHIAMGNILTFIVLTIT